MTDSRCSEYAYMHCMDGYRNNASCSGYGTNIGIPKSVCSPSLLSHYLEGPWSEVTKAIHDCHAAVHALGAQRIATDIRIGTRIDREIVPGTGNAHKVTRVEELLASEAEQNPTSK